MQADTNFVASRFSSRLRPRAEDGFGIIEVLVSAILVVIVSTGVFVAFDAATNASGTNKARSAASNIARSDQERLRGMTAQQLATLPSAPQTQVVDGREYFVTSTTAWVADRTGTPSCSSADGRADYLKLRTSVTWNKMGGLSPVVVDSLRAIPRGAFRPNQGSIAVKITDRNGAGVPGATVSISGTTGYNTTTNANGCVLIDQVPVGTYTATITKSGYIVDKYPNDATFVKNFTVAKEQTSSVLGTMDLAGTGRVAFRTTTSVCTTTCTEAATTGDGFTFANTGLINPTEINYALATGTAANQDLYTGDAGVALTTSTTRDAFPFSGAYKVWAGACDEANPRRWLQPEVSQVVPPGALTPATPTTDFYVRVPRLQISIKLASGNLNRSRIVAKPVGTGCSRPAVVENTSTTTATHTATFSLPYGDYNLCMQEGQGTPTGTGAGSGATATTAKRMTATVQNRLAGGSAPATFTLPNTATSGSCPYN